MTRDASQQPSDCFWSVCPAWFVPCQLLRMLPGMMLSCSSTNPGSSQLCSIPPHPPGNPTVVAYAQVVAHNVTDEWSIHRPRELRAGQFADQLYKVRKHRWWLAAVCLLGAIGSSLLAGPPGSGLPAGAPGPACWPEPKMPRTQQPLGHQDAALCQSCWQLHGAKPAIRTHPAAAAPALLLPAPRAAPAMSP